jgi:hypothetical protein
MNSLAVERSEYRLFKAAKRRYGTWEAVLLALRAGHRNRGSRDYPADFGED